MQQRYIFLKKVRRTNKEIGWSDYRRSRNAGATKCASLKPIAIGTLFRKTLMAQNRSGEL